MNADVELGDVPLWAAAKSALALEEKLRDYRAAARSGLPHKETTPLGLGRCRVRFELISGVEVAPSAQISSDSVNK